MKVMNAAKKRQIKTAYDAWWFLYQHPKFCLLERKEVLDAKHAKTFPFKYWKIKKDKGGNLWAYSKRLYRHAIELNLNIFYAKTDRTGGHGTINTDKSKNKYVECWLEFGHEAYEYVGEWEWKQDKARDHLTPYHDYKVDAGGTTFDEALISLAKNVLKEYGNYKRGHD